MLLALVLLLVLLVLLLVLVLLVLLLALVLLLVLLELLLVLASVPPSGGGLHGPQMPLVLPTATTQVSPTQQSAFVVHAPQDGTQVPLPW